MLLVENSARPLLSHDEKTLSGLFAEMGTFNQNGRRYPEDIYETAYEKLIPKIQERRLLGELDHPMDYDEVRLSNVSHAITECEIIEENGIKKIYGTVELLDTPAGMIAQSLVKAGIPLGISSRGVGATRQVSEGSEVTQFNLITYDLVAEPSFSNAVLSPDKSHELQDSLDYIESKLPLTESVESDSVRTMITNIRESLINRKTTPSEEIDINQAEIDSLRGLLESANSTIKSDTKLLTECRRDLKSLRRELEESKIKYKKLMKNMFNLQESYNSLKESALTDEQANRLQEDLLTTKKRLAVERRGISYNQVSDLLEGATTEEEIESRLNSLSSLSKSRQSTYDISSSLTESKKVENKRLTGLAAIVAKV